MHDASPKYVRFHEDQLGMRRLRSGTPGALHLVGIPYAGGQSLGFRPLVQHLPEAWGAWALDPPGHGWALGTPLDCVEQLADLYVQHLPTSLWQGALLFGHSLGGYVAYALAQRLETLGAEPAGVVISATVPPQHRSAYASFLTMDDATLLDVLIRFGGVPSQWAQDPEVFDHFKDALRADFRAFEAFNLQPPQVRLPLLALAAQDDVVCRPEHARSWQQALPGCQFDVLPGDHMYLHTRPAELARRLVDFATERSHPGNAPP